MSNVDEIRIEICVRSKNEYDTGIGTCILVSNQSIMASKEKLQSTIKKAAKERVQ